LPERQPSTRQTQSRVFVTALGISADDAEELRQAILSAVLANNATPTERDEYGQRFIVDFSMRRESKEAVVRSSWIVRRGEDFPRLTSCYVL
jgi:hypothetical protein